MSYRLSVLDELPRAGLPDPFQSAGEYDRTVATLVSAGLIEDASKLWWDIRPSARFPTLEMRVTDLCTRLEDALCLAALFRCVCRLLYRLRRNNQSWRIHSRLLVNENRWRAQRYGSDRGLVDFGIGEVVPFEKLLSELLDLIAEDADHFGCTARGGASPSPSWPKGPARTANWRSGSKPKPPAPTPPPRCARSSTGSPRRRSWAPDGCLKTRRTP